MTHAWAPLCETSRQAYEVIRREGTLGEMQCRILGLIVEFPDSTAQEITQRLVEQFGGVPDPNRARPRIRELVKAGYVEEGRPRVCTVTGLRAAIWRIRTNDPQRSLF